MLKEEIKSIVSKQSRAELRKFGLILGIVLAVLAGFAFYKQNSLYLLFTGGAILFFLISFLWPMALKQVHRIWMTIAVTMGYVMTRVLLTLFYFIAFVPAGLVMRLFRLDVLKQKADPNAKTYWIPKEKSHSGRYSVESQF